MVVSHAQWTSTAINRSRIISHKLSAFIEITFVAFKRRGICEYINNVIDFKRSNSQSSELVCLKWKVDVSVAVLALRALSRIFFPK